MVFHLNFIWLLILLQIRIDTDNSGLKLTMFQFQTCPFCCKVRAMLDYYGFSYDVVEVNSVTKKQIKWSNYRKVPIIVVDGKGENGFLVSKIKGWLCLCCICCCVDADLLYCWTEGVLKTKNVAVRENKSKYMCVCVCVCCMELNIIISQMITVRRPYFVVVFFFVCFHGLFLFCFLFCWGLFMHYINSSIDIHYKECGIKILCFQRNIILI